MILLDSSFIIAYYSERDQHHRSAREFMKKIAAKEFGNTFISDYILDEIATGLLKRAGLVETVRICNDVLQSNYLSNIDDILFNRTLDIFKRQKSTKMSFTDCSNLALMEDKGIRNLAAFDDDFKHVDKINLVTSNLF